MKLISVNIVLIEGKNKVPDLLRISDVVLIAHDIVLIKLSWRDCKKPLVYIFYTQGYQTTTAYKF